MLKYPSGYGTLVRGKRWFESNLEHLIYNGALGADGQRTDYKRRPSVRTRQRPVID